MKALITSIMMAFAIMPSYADKQPETKRVCIQEKDAKTGKTKEVCRTIKIHKKLEGTKVPDKKR
jgi:hypothetical protein